MRTIGQLRTLEEIAVNARCHDLSCYRSLLVWVAENMESDPIFCTGSELFSNYAPKPP
jgi:hypothetical protein